jgi:hypothetical protein
MNSCILTGRPDGLDEHHVIPRSYGGVDGPVVWLASDMHVEVHTQALALYRTKDEGLIQYPSGLPDTSRDKFLYLVRTIVNARIAYESAKKARLAPKQSVSVKLDTRRTKRVDELAQALNCSQRHVINMAIDRLYQKNLTRSNQNDQLEAQSRSDR